MYRIAVLLTCFNRKEKTLKALSALHKAHEIEKDRISMSIYLTDDGSTDGTGEAVKTAYPEIKVLQGTGDLYWAGGMRHSWTEAKKRDYDAYLLLNDDTFVESRLFTELLDTHTYCLKKYGQGGVYCGATKDKETQEYTYGGHNFTNKFFAAFKSVIPNGKTPQECELGNANIMWVSKNVVDKVGILSDGYVHGLADYDYTLKAVKEELPVLITPNYLGTCVNDHSNPYIKFPKLSFKQRLDFLYNPIGLDFKSNLTYNKRHFPIRYPFVYLTGWLKVFFPNIYNKRHRHI
ncbi:glycosyltransferase family 2 protein [Maribacter algicola]|uniref:Glycosyltransferase family 2 protein n=1 Tax=Maribacter algicola TaxID=2498892 RepID=A0A426RIK0_9FLAO|nr:glycosyltransferase [Maribacter algicola]RRQ48845.1 glycosyltransferase family 2 protein [Maribacter algicola]